jgi:hypothetical protein
MAKKGAEDQLYKLARSLARIFEELGVEYFLVGGLAVKEYDDYRLTYDVDFVVAPVRVEAGPGEKAAGELADRLWDWAEDRGLGISTKRYGARLPVSEVTRENVEKALQAGDQTLEFWSEGRKMVDIIVGRAGPERFDEEVYTVINGIKVAVPEYIIASKLWLIKGGMAEDRDHRDALRLLAHHDIDRGRLGRYAEELKVSALLKRYQKTADVASARIQKVVGAKGKKRRVCNSGRF